MTTELLAGRYRRLSALGRGAMGEVWLADDELLGRRVAVKRLRMDLVGGGDPQALERIGREARVAARLHHPNIVGVFDLVTEDDQPHLIMEYVEGESLAERLRRTGPVPAGEAAGIFAQTARALDAAHRAGIVHRDVKPANILITPNGDAKLADFGIARSHGDSALTETGHTIGTVAYMSPEIARGSDATAASDMWSLGATLYAAVEGHSPHGGTGQASAATLLVRLVTEPVPPPHHAGPLGPVLSGLLSNDPAARPSAGELARELAAVANDPTSTIRRSALADASGPTLPAAEGRPAPGVEPTTTVAASAGAPQWAQQYPPAANSPWANAGHGPAVRPPLDASANRLLAAHAVMWGGFLLLITLLTNWSYLQRAFYAEGAGLYGGGLHLSLFAGSRLLLGLFEVAPVAVAAVIVGMTVERRLVGVGAAVAAGVAEYVLWASASTAVWVVSVLLVLLVLAGWLAARRRAAGAYLALAPAALFAALYYYPHGPGPWLQGLPYRSGIHGAFFIVLWGYAPFLVAGIAALVAASVVRHVVSSGPQRVGVAVLGGLVAATLVAALLAQTAFTHSYQYVANDNPGYTDTSTPPATTLDASTASSTADQLFSDMENSSSVDGCDGSMDALDLQSYQIGQVTPQTSGQFEVSADVTLNDGSTETVSILVGTDAGDQPCVENSSVEQYVSSTPTATPSPTPTVTPPSDVPTVPSHNDPVPTDASLPDPPSDGALAYDADTLPTTPAQIVEYQPDGLDPDQTAAVASVITFMTNVNLQHLAAAFSSSIYSVTGQQSEGKWQGGWKTSAFYQVAFGQPVLVDPTLMIVPSRWISRQDPAAQHLNPAVSCYLWPQFLFLMKKLADGRWVWAQDQFQNRSDVTQYERIDDAGDPVLNPVQQRQACDAPAPPPA